MARLQKKTQAAVTTGSAETSGIPRTMGLRLICDFLGDRLACPRLRRRLRAAQASAPGGQDHTISPSASVCARLAQLIAATAPRTPRIVTTRTSLFDEAGCRHLIT